MEQNAKDKEEKKNRRIGVQMPNKEASKMIKDAKENNLEVICQLSSTSLFIVTGAPSTA